MKRFSWVIFALLLCVPFSAISAQEDKGGSRLKADTFAGLELRGIGPALMSGRIADIAIHPEKHSTWYVAVGSGNVWIAVHHQSFYPFWKWTGSGYLTHHDPSWRVIRPDQTINHSGFSDW